jgi:septum formation protein
LLVAAGYDVSVNAVDADESWPPGEVDAGLIAICRRKLAHAAPYTTPTIAADTVVVLGNTRFGKPADAGEAQRFLGRLSGREHLVKTGYVIRYRDQERLQVVTTRVRFRILDAIEIERYAATGEALDKAGGYGIQGEGGALIETILGSYTNVVGLPLTEVKQTLEALTGSKP